MIDSAIFIGAVIIAITQAIKFLSPKVSGLVTMAVAIVVGIVVALVDKQIGVVDITVAQGIFIALGAIGFHTTITARSTPTVPTSPTV